MEHESGFTPPYIKLGVMLGLVKVGSHQCVRTILGLLESMGLVRVHICAPLATLH